MVDYFVKSMVRLCRDYNDFKIQGQCTTEHWFSEFYGYWLNLIAQKIKITVYFHHTNFMEVRSKSNYELNDDSNYNVR